MTDFRSIIDAERTRRGLSVAALARAADVPRPNLQNWLSGKRGIHADSLERVAHTLKLRLRPGHAG